MSQTSQGSFDSPSDGHPVAQLPFPEAQSGLRAPPAFTALSAGDDVGGKYRVERVLGSRGRGTVVEVRHTLLDRRMALKLIEPSARWSPRASQGFLRAGKALASLETPHVCHVLDLDLLPDGTPYLVLELLEGETVAERFAREKSPSVEVAVALLSQALLALREAHARGIWHGDFNPHHLFIARNPDGKESIKVLDFSFTGSALTEVERGVTSTPEPVLRGGSPYLAPEQLAANPTLDARADVWAAGVVLYELIAGRRPHLAPSEPELSSAIARGPHESLQQIGAAVWPALNAVVERCLQQRAEDRFPDAAALADALTAAMGVAPHAVASSPVSVASSASRSEVEALPTQPVDASETLAISNVTSGPHDLVVVETGRRSLWLAVTAGLALASIAFYVALSWGPSNGAPTDVAPTSLSARVPPASVARPASSPPAPQIAPSALPKGRPVAAPADEDADLVALPHPPIARPRPSRVRPSASGEYDERR